MPAGESASTDGVPAGAPVLGRRQDGLWLDLVRSGAADGEPFVVLHEGRHTRVLLAEIRVGGAGGGELEVVRPLVLKVRSDAYAPRTPGHGRPLANPEVDEAWQREVADLGRVRSAHVVATVPVPDGALSGPPLTYCRRRDVFLHAVCGETGAVLRTCKDDDLLADCGLVKYGADTWRYLHAGPEASGRTFYRLPGANSERPRQGVQVRVGSELYRSWARLVHAETGDAAGANDTAAATARRRALAAGLPCLSCEHRSECFPAGAGTAAAIPAEEQLLPVTFHDFAAVALELLDFDYDDVCDLLGGAELASVVAASMPALQSRRELLQRRGAALAGGGQWLFGGEPLRFPLEVLRQKLALFVGVVEGVRAVHAATGRPHFAVAPQNVMATLLPQPAGTPVRWGFQARVVDLGSAVRFLQPGLLASGLPPLLEPGPELREDLRMRAYQSPELQGLDGQTMSLVVSVRRAPGTAAEQVRLLVEAQGASNLKQFRPGDVVCVMPSGGAATGELVLWASLGDVKPRGFQASALVPLQHPCLRWDGKSIDARVMFFRHIGPPVDLYGLGMMLFRALLVDDEQGIDEVEEAVGKVLRRLKDELSSLPVDEAMVMKRLQHHLHGKDVRARFERAHVLHRREAREAFAQQCRDGTPPIENGIWQGLLRIAFKLTTQLSGFSYSTSFADGSPFVLRQVAEDVEAVRRRVHVDLFARLDRDRALHAAIEQVLEELRAELLAGPGEVTDAGAEAAQAPSTGFRLLIEKEGGDGGQEQVFDREQVTIGRKEDNLVRLVDQMVSSAHAVIELQDGGYVVIDRNSRNGTEVDGVRIPVDVPMPLEDGSVVTIRPFTLTFRSGGASATTAARSGRPSLEMTTVVETLSGDQIGDLLQAEYARCQQAPPAQQHEAVRQVLVRARSAMGASELLGKLEPLLQQFAGGATPPPGTTDGAPRAPAAPAPAFFAAAHKALQGLARQLAGQEEFRSAEEIDLFAAKLGAFVDVTCAWIEQVMQMRRDLMRQLDPGGRGSNPAGMRGSASEVRLLALGSGALAADAFLTKFYADAEALLENLLKTPDAVRRLVREKLDPRRFVAAAPTKASFGGGDVTQTPLWRAYVQAFQELVDSKQLT